MKVTPLCAFLCCLLLITPATFSNDVADQNSTSVPKEITELKQLVRELTERLSRIEKRLELLENRAAHQSPTGYLRFPLEVEDGMMFDAHEMMKKQMRRLLDDSSFKRSEPRR